MKTFNEKFAHLKPLKNSAPYFLIAGIVALAVTIIEMEYEELKAAQPQKEQNQDQ